MKVLITVYSKSETLDLGFLIEDIITEIYPIQEPEKQNPKPFTALQIKPALDYAMKHEFDLVVCADPIYERLAIAVRKYRRGAFIFLNIHQLAAILFNRWNQKAPEESLLCLKSIHLSDMLDNMAAQFELDCIRRIINPGELKKEVGKHQALDEKQSICAFNIDQQVIHTGYTFGEVIQLLIELEKDRRNRGETIFDELMELYQQYGFYKEKAVSVDFTGEKQKKNLLSIMEGIRKDPNILEHILPLSTITDYRKGKKKNLLTNKNYEFINITGNVLRIDSTRNISLTFAPSDARMIHYASIRVGITSKGQYADRNQDLDLEIINAIKMLNKVLKK
ncbi:MAG: hypothetical protein WD426_16850 [Anditalea sp.]